MPEIALDSSQLKEMLKIAIVELLRENKAELYELLAKVIEAISMERAIAEGSITKKVSRESESIFRILDSDLAG